MEHFADGLSAPYIEQQVGLALRELNRLNEPADRKQALEFLLTYAAAELATLVKAAAAE